MDGRGMQDAGHKMQDSGWKESEKVSPPSLVLWRMKDNEKGMKRESGRKLAAAVAAAVRKKVRQWDNESAVAKAMADERE